MIEADFDCLRLREILDILIGDKTFEQLEEVDVSMPYLTASSIIGIARIFGFNTQNMGGSRWTIIDDILNCAINESKTSKVLKYVFDLQQFSDKFKNIEQGEVHKMHKLITGRIIEEINKKLFFSNKKLSFITDCFYISNIDQKIIISTPALKSIDTNYIEKLNERVEQDFLQNNYDSVITKARTLIEEVLIYILEKKDIDVPKSGEILELNKLVKNALNMQQGSEKDKRINAMLSGIEKIIQAVAEMRNTNSDAHGAGSKRINIREHEARLAVNSAITASDYILSVYNFQNSTR